MCVCVGVSHRSMCVSPQVLPLSESNNSDCAFKALFLKTHISLKIFSFGSGPAVNYQVAGRRRRLIVDVKKTANLLKDSTEISH